MMNHYAAESGIFILLSDRTQLPCQPQRHLSLDPIISPLLQPCGRVKRITETFLQSTSPWHMLLTIATPVVCCIGVRQLNKELHCEYRIWCPTVHPRADHRNVFLLWYEPTHGHNHTSTQNTRHFLLWQHLCVSACYRSKSTGCLRFAALSCPSLPKLCHEICIRIQYVGIQCQHAEPKDQPVCFVNHSSKTSFF